QRRRTDVEDDVHPLLNGDHVVFGGHLLVRPGGRIRPAAGRRRSSILSLNDSGCADKQDCWQERSKKERAMSRTHGINPPYSKTKPTTAAATRSAIRRQHRSNPKRVADFRGSRVCDSRPPRCTGQMTLGAAPMMVLGRRSSTRV